MKSKETENENIGWNLTSHYDEQSLCKYCSLPERTNTHLLLLHTVLGIFLTYPEPILKDAQGEERWGNYLLHKWNPMLRASADRTHYMNPAHCVVFIQLLTKHIENNGPKLVMVINFSSTTLSSS